MARLRAYLPALAISAQALINIPFYGIPAILLTTILPASLTGHHPWLLSPLILLYFSLAIVYLYHAGVAPDPGLKRAKLAGGAYFLLGLVASLAVVISSLSRGDYETPLLPIFMGVWGALSMLGLAGLIGNVERISKAVSLPLIFLVALSAVVSASTLEW
ncbi:hypothetical protein A3L11_03080 [Thermococcus siculi]|uniref:Uncharacterized protein n=1 Tax=Thermococcus siculi TaxID=72803 RepID=A0A2Z2MVQ3_9EURY|nr:hypothetical protein [Thermococcus siculi]ASJ08263.1 hypothetical protein A3L11_03080 [Thermococcus siculi]